VADEKAVLVPFHWVCEGLRKNVCFHVISFAVVEVESFVFAYALLMKPRDADAMRSANMPQSIGSASADAVCSSLVVLEILHDELAVV
jgi:hypothetical protein